MTAILSAAPTWQPLALVIGIPIAFFLILLIHMMWIDENRGW